MRSVRFGLVLTEREKHALAKLTEAEGDLSQAAVVRRLIRQEAQRRGLLNTAPATPGQAGGMNNAERQIQDQ